MKSLKRGKNTSFPEITNVSPHGFWILHEGKELFVPFDKFPWFKEVELKKIFNVRLEAPGHFYWPDLDVDLSEKIIQEPEKFRLVAKAN